MQRDSDDDVWRAIVDNYGDRADLGPETVAPPTPPEPLAVAAPEPDRQPDPQSDFGLAENDLQRDDTEPFVPPEPPPLPRPSRDRLAAWIGVFGSPAILLIALIARVSVPHWLGYLLVAGFVGGFLYLVIQMPRGPRDPFDDGARL